MTRSEFTENWESGIWGNWDVIDVMRNENYDDADEIIAGDDYDSCVEEDIRDFLSNRFWYDMDLSMLPRPGGDWYRRNACLDYDWLEDEDIDDIVNGFIDWMDSGEYWEDEPEEEEEEPEEPEERPEPESSRPEFADEEFFGLLTVCQSDLQVISREIETDRETRREEFDRACLLSVREAEEYIPF